MTLTTLKRVIQRLGETCSLEDCPRNMKFQISGALRKEMERDENKQQTSSVHGKSSARAISRQIGIRGDRFRIIFNRYLYKAQHVEALKSTVLTIPHILQVDFSCKWGVLAFL